ncbi:hypothetical protein PRUPE_1G203100 [Prunus persica]|uniref:Uncharacterized protein n=1 Tax=Prunus persica TaxID=3760 RepID=A0A251R0Q7_PRUPE|nr:hypothetical protein PRUPE_1G203100 [Prunus persica]
MTISFFFTTQHFPVKLYSWLSLFMEVYPSWVNPATCFFFLCETHISFGGGKKEKVLWISSAVVVFR